MSEEMKQQTEAVAAGMNRLPEEVRANAVKLMEAYANGLAAGIALADRKDGQKGEVNP